MQCIRGLFQERLDRIYKALLGWIQRNVGGGPSPSRFLDWIRPHSAPTIDVIWAGLFDTVPYQKNEDTCVSRYPLIGLN